MKILFSKALPKKLASTTLAVLIAVVIVILANKFPFGAGTKHYSSKGIEFSYPKSWAVTEQVIIKGTVDIEISSPASQRETAIWIKCINNYNDSRVDKCTRNSVDVNIRTYSLLEARGIWTAKDISHESYATFAQISYSKNGTLAGKTARVAFSNSKTILVRPLGPNLLVVTLRGSDALAHPTPEQQQVLSSLRIEEISL